MASGGDPPLAGIGITPKANVHMALWGIMSPEGPCCFQETSALFSRARGEDEDCPNIIGRIGTDTIIVTIRGVYGHDRACHGLLESLHPVARIMWHNEGMIARRSFGMTAIRMRTMTERPLRRGGFIWEVRRKLDE